MAKLKTFQERLKTNDFPEPAPWTSPDQCQAAYEQGLPFVSPDPEGEEELADLVKSEGNSFNGEDVATENGFAGLSKDKDLALLWPEAYKASGHDDWIVGNPAQQVGDCLKEDSVVALAGGNKMIKDVVVGDIVKTPFHGEQEVRSLFRKSFEGMLFTVDFGNTKVQCTPDHLFLTPSKAWIAAENLEMGNAVVTQDGTVHVNKVSSEPWSGTVYCFEVDRAHCFFANGVAVHNCVSHSTRNALMLSMACQVTSGNGGWPTDIPPESYSKMTCFTSVPLYNLRSNAPGHGWSCPTSVKEARNIGLVVARDWTAEVGIDYSKYSGSQTTKFGRSGPPDSYVKALGDHPVMTSCSVKGLDSLLDLLAGGQAMSTCGGESWATGSSARNSDGYAERTKKGWSHALCYYGYIKTKEWMDKYSEVGIIIGNSWGSSSCGGNRKIMGRDDLPLLPKNCWIAKWSECKNRSVTAVSSLQGWKPAKLQDWGDRISGLI